MGSWGEGMQANDTAWDAIGLSGFNVNGKVPKKTVEALKKKPASVIKYYTAGIIESPHAVLGLTEYFLDSGVNVDAVKKFAEEALVHEFENVDNWRHPKIRREALERFQNRLEGKPVDMEKVSEDNEGLLSRIFRNMH